MFKLARHQPSPPLHSSLLGPPVCPAFVAEDATNAQLIRSLHWVLRQVASFLLPGTRPILLGAAQALDASGLCVDVVWALEVREWGWVAGATGSTKL